MKANLFERAGFTGEILLEEPLRAHSSFCIGGPAQYFLVPHSLEDARLALAVAGQEGLPLFILGGGSNILAPDEGLRGVVLCTRGGLDRLDLEDGLIRAGAGVTDEALAEFALGLGVAGFEWIFDIPGTVGGAVFMNAGNNEGDAAGNTTLVRWLDRDGALHETSAGELDFSYRHSLFHSRPGLVVEALLHGQGQDEPSAIRQRMDASRALRKSKFPPEVLCAGSVFKRPKGDFAGRLIEVAGCGGLRIGDAKVSEKHKGFIVNCGEATGAQVLALLEEVRRRVLDSQGVELEPEVCLLEEKRFL